MKLLLQADRRRWRAGQEVTVRLLAVNDSARSVRLDRARLVGPQLVHLQARGAPFPARVDSSFPMKSPLVLRAGEVYGREVTYSGLDAGTVRVHAYLLRGARTRRFPLDPGQAVASAEPLVLTVSARR